MIGEVRDVARDDGLEEVVVERDDVEAEDGAVWIGLLNRNGVERDRRSPSTSTAQVSGNPSGLRTIQLRVTSNGASPW